MAINSMTGFARTGGETQAFSWQWEIRSVNGRGLDVRLRLPGGFEALEPPVRQQVAARLRRGNVQVSLLVRMRDAAQELKVNRALLQALADEALRVGRRLQHQVQARLDVGALLAVRGVVETMPLDFATLAQRHADELLDGFAQALDELVQMRAREGERLAAILSAQVDEIARLQANARAHPALAPESVRARLREQVARLLDAADGELDEQRLYQEAALLAVKADVTEELDRLQAHVAAVRELLSEGGAVGRRLEFLAQEFHREANTLCSKAVDADITAVGVALKTVIDQFREQAANVE